MGNLWWELCYGVHSLWAPLCGANKLVLKSQNFDFVENGFVIHMYTEKRRSLSTFLVCVKLHFVQSCTLCKVVFCAKLHFAWESFRCHSISVLFHHIMTSSSNSVTQKIFHSCCISKGFKNIYTAPQIKIRQLLVNGHTFHKTYFILYYRL